MRAKLFDAIALGLLIFCSVGLGIELSKEDDSSVISDTSYTDVCSDK